MLFDWGAIEPDASSSGGHPASHTWDGKRIIWRPAFPADHVCALDVERLNTPRPEGIGPPGLTDAEFLLAWTRLEVIAKLRDIPIAMLIRNESFTVPPLGISYLSGKEYGLNCNLYSGRWDEQNLMFTCGFLPHKK